MNDIAKLGKPLRAVFFDMDGTLYDSMPFHAETLFLAFEQLGIEFTRKDAYLNEGRPTHDIVNAVFNKKLKRDAEPWENEKVLQFIRDYQRNRLNGMPKVSGMDDVLHWCSLRRIDTYLVTGSPRDSKLIENISADFPNYFPTHRIIPGDEVHRGKPFPDPYLKALALSGYTKEEVLVIENAPLGVDSGNAAGLFTIAINTGLLDVEDLNHANLLFTNANDLLLYLKNSDHD